MSNLIRFEDFLQVPYFLITVFFTWIDHITKHIVTNIWTEMAQKSYSEAIF